MGQHYKTGRGGWVAKPEDWTASSALGCARATPMRVVTMHAMHGGHYGMRGTRCGLTLVFVCALRARHDPGALFARCSSDRARAGERVSMPCSPRPHTAQIGRAWRWLLKACRSVAQALEHEEKRDAAGTQRRSGRWERALPKPQPHQVTWALRVSVCPCHALLTTARPARCCPRVRRDWRTLAYTGVTLFHKPRGRHANPVQCNSKRMSRRCLNGKCKISLRASRPGTSALWL